MKNLDTLLSQLGLSDKEAAIYIALLHRGETTASGMAEHLGIPRSTAKFLLNQMVQKKIIVEDGANNTTTYSIETTDALSYMVTHEKSLLEKREVLFSQVLGALKNIHNPSSILPRIKFYEGVSNTIGLMYEFLGNGKENLRIFGAVEHMRKFAPNEIDQYIDFSMNLTQNSKIIKGSSYKNHSVSQSTHYKIKFYTDFAEPTVEIQIAKGKVCIISFEEGKISGLLIEHEEIAHGFEQIFDELWQLL